MAKYPMFYVELQKSAGLKVMTYQNFEITLKQTTFLTLNFTLTLEILCCKIDIQLIALGAKPEGHAHTIWISPKILPFLTLVIAQRAGSTRRQRKGLVWPGL